MISLSFALLPLLTTARLISRADPAPTLSCSSVICLYDATSGGTTNTSQLFMHQVMHDDIVSQGYIPQYECPNYNETAGQFYASIQGTTDYFHAYPNCTFDYCNALAGDDFLPQMQSCYARSSLRCSEEDQKLVNSSAIKIHPKAKEYCKNVNVDIPDDRLLPQPDLSTIGLADDDEKPSSEMERIQGDCAPSCGFKPPFTRSQVSLSVNFRSLNSSVGWKPLFACDHYGEIAARQTGSSSLSKIHPDCEKDYCEAMGSKEFVKVMEDCYERHCRDDPDFELNMRFVRSLTRRDPFQTKVNTTWAMERGCNASAMDLPEWENVEQAEDSSEAEDESSDPQDDEPSVGSALVHWGTELTVVAALVGGLQILL
ncbi:hypothetical protein BJ508DRAFT_381579 [Ascobolus immersus RN42]|uniref:Uncharacterized protein n=1 Tax=Ascobolus immersus RN42 TaxID=1160509 RepID=A0A3N4HKG7_ASCIM|nr:hypothetical protein BJ508DRAFT_381579 [Ascobolus immersus RN42]